MNIPTIIGAILIFALFAAIVIRGIYNKKRHKSSCSCGCACDGCPGIGACHPKG